MPRLRSLSVSLKLPALIIVIALGCLGVAGAVAYKASLAQLMQEVSLRLSMLDETRAALIEDWGARMRTALSEEAAEPSMIEAVSRLLVGYRGLGSEANAHLRSGYVDGNPNPADQRAELLAAPDGTAYARFHALYHPAMRARVKAIGLRDLLIVSAAGDVLYSVRKEGNFATNVAAAPGSLGTAVRAALAEGAEFGFGDFATDPEAGGAAAAYLAAPLHDASGAVVAALVFEPDGREIARIAEMRSGRTDSTRLAVIAPDLTLRSARGLDGTPEALGTPLPLGSALDAVLAGAADGESGMARITLPSGTEVAAAFQPVSFAGQRWLLLAAEPSEVIAAGPRALLAQLARATAAALVVALLLAWLAARNLAQPLRRIAAAVGKVAAGDYESEIPAQARGDEIGRISRALDALRGDLRRNRDALDAGASARAAMLAAQTDVVEALQSALARLAGGDLGSVISRRFPDEYEQLRSDFNRATDRLHQAMIDVSQSAEAIGQDVDHIAQASEELGQRTERQAATVEQTAAALDELTASVSEAAKNAAEVDTLVGKAREDARTSGEVVRETIEAIGVIEASFQQISGNIKVIDDIAFQTNLLALNAGVEAARAGEAGLGFAVVASEVRLLAQRCSEAAREINIQITDSSEHVQNGVRLAGRTGGALKEIIAAIRIIAERVTAIAESAREQSTGLSELNSAVSELDMTTQKNAAMFEETSAASADLRRAALGLRQHVGRFTLGSGAESWEGAEAAELPPAPRSAPA
ncbi:methyl-accepting chemotaxis protein [Salipiger sp. H15]|uniref:Methyl-accepting chemotaxis protein n=1 Tax=Alloyangia sp. H15 TaxID=3029062 RepID=A0AAU8AFY7_9RHOB